MTSWGDYLMMVMRYFLFTHVYFEDYEIAWLCAYKGIGYN